MDIFAQEKDFGIVELAPATKGYIEIGPDRETDIRKEWQELYNDLLRLNELQRITEQSKHYITRRAWEK